MKFVVFLRGINVGGKSRVKMAELEQLLTGLGYGGVKTYIQSGNVVLDAQEDEPALCARIREAFAARFGFESGIVARASEALRGVVESLPFSAEDIAQAEASDPQVEHLYVYFLEQSPGDEALEALRRSMEEGDGVGIGEREIYLLCRRSVRLSKTALKVGKLFPCATARNWNTVQKLRTMLLEA